MTNIFESDVWKELDADERSIYLIARAYQRFAYSKHNNIKYISERSADAMRENKHWQYFKRVWDNYSENPTFDPDRFMNCIESHLKAGEYIQPAQLATKKNFDNYVDYTVQISANTDNLKQILFGIQQSYKFIANKMETTELDQEKIYEFFNSNKVNMWTQGLLACTYRTISPYYFCMSKSFIDAYRGTDQDIQDEIMLVDDLENMINTIKQNPRIYEFDKKVFGEDII
jgi:hypothetical protein